MRSIIISVMVVLLTAASVQAKVDLVTLPTRESVQLTIYNSSDLTLVKDSRILTLKKGDNQLQFSWANTLIDPTSIEIQPKSQADKITVMDLSYPARVTNIGLWNIRSEVSGKMPFEISYLTSGLTWRAFYLGTLSPDEKKMRLAGFVRVTNSSGEDYEDAQTRLIVGQVHILDQIAELARRKYPYGRPIPEVPLPPLTADIRMVPEAEFQKKAKKMMAAPAGPKEIKKEGLSEYFLYTIEGKETIPQNWSKRLPSFETAEVPVVNIYKYEEERFNREVVRFLGFKNDKGHKLGETPIPGGQIQVSRVVDEAGHLTFEGRSEFKYIPVEEDIELNLGPVSNVVVEAKLMDFKTDNYTYDQKGNINGWDEIREFRMIVKNTRSLAVKIEIRRNFPTAAWELKYSGDTGQYEKVDLDTVKFTMTLPEKSKKEFVYTLTTHHGKRAE